MLQPRGQLRYGAELFNGNSLGFFTLEGAFSNSKLFDTGYSAALDYSSKPWSRTQRNPITMSLRGEYRSEKFSLPLNQSITNRYEWMLGARLGQSLSAKLNASLGANYYLGRGGYANQFDFNANLNWRLSRQMQFRVDYTNRTFFEKTPTVDQGMLLSLSWQGRKGKNYVNSYYNAFEQELGMEYTNNSYFSAQHVSTGLEASRRPEWNNLGASLLMNNQRYTLGARHNTRNVESTGQWNHYTNLNLGTALAFAGGRMALSRPISDSFVLIGDSPKSKFSYPMKVDKFGEFSRAEKNWLGPASLSNVSAYRVGSTNMYVQELPPGVSLEDDRFYYRPTYKSGVRVDLNFTGEMAAKGQLLSPSGKMIPLSSGFIEAMAPPGDSRKEFFTNKKSLAYFEGLQPGKYKITLYSRDTIYEHTFKMPENVVGIVNLGTIRLKEKKKR